MTNTAPKYFTKFKPHVDRLNLNKKVFKRLKRVPKTNKDIRRCKKAALDITNQILKIPKNRRFPYWNTKIYTEFKGMTPLEIELKILKDHMRDNYAFKTKYGRLPYLHALTALSIMLPHRDITPTLADQMYLSMGMFSYGRKRLISNGAMNSGKTSFGVAAGVLYPAIDQENNFIICGCPYEKSAKSTIFGDYVNMYKSVADALPINKEDRVGGNSASSLFPFCNIKEGKLISLQKLTTKGGWIEYRTLKSEGVAQGMKGNSSDKRETIGIFQIDELPLVKNIGKFESDTANVQRQRFFQLQAFQNPEDETDAGGQMSQPKKWGDWGWSDFNELRKDQPDIWPSEKSGIVYRLPAHKQINVILGKVVYDYLTTQSDIDGIIEDHGKDSREYWSQILAMYPGGGMSNTLLTTSDVTGSKMEVDDYTILRENFKAVGVDPSETELGDNAIITVAKSCECLIRYIDGSTERKNLIIPYSPYEGYSGQIRVSHVNNFTWQPICHNGEVNRFWDRYVAVGGEIKHLTLGAEISYPEQIFLTVAEICKKEGIPLKNVVYDGSCRANMGKAATLMMGHAPTAIPLRDKPIGFQLQARNQNTDTFCKNVNSEALYAGADVIASKQVRDVSGILRLASLQLCRRKIVSLTKQPQKKIDYKNENGQVSPDHADSWCYLVWFMLRLGFKSESIRKKNKTGQSAFAKAQQSSYHTSLLGGELK